MKDANDNTLQDFVRHYELFGMPPVQGPEKPADKNDAAAMQNWQKENDAWQQKTKEWDVKAVACVEKMMAQELQKKRQERMPFVIVPDQPLDLDITDKDFNRVFRICVYKPQSDDAMKALRRKGYTTKLFAYDKQKWEEEAQERSILQAEVKNATYDLMQNAVVQFQNIFVALMHLKVVRAYIDGVLRFGIPPKFYIGLVLPRKGAEKAILNDMCGVLSDDSMRDMYGEKTDANDNEDYWPFVCVHLTSPNFMHVQKE